MLFRSTSGSAPTAQRSTSATLIRRGGDRVLFDCGEGTQRQLLRSDAGLVDLERIFLTHFHADHYLGLPGLLKTFMAPASASAAAPAISQVLVYVLMAAVLVWRPTGLFGQRS